MPPIETRANVVKATLSDTENLKVKLENKDADLKELKKQLKLKVSDSGSIPTAAFSGRAALWSHVRVVALVVLLVVEDTPSAIIALPLDLPPLLHLAIGDGSHVADRATFALTKRLVWWPSQEHGLSGSYTLWHDNLRVGETLKCTMCISLDRHHSIVRSKRR